MEFLFRCLEQFTVDIWTFNPLTKMNAYLRKIAKGTCIEIDLQRIMGWNLCKINKHFLQFPYKIDLNCVNGFTHDKIISDFFLKYLNIHLGNTLLVNNMSYKTYLNLPFNAIFVESYEYAPKDDNYFILSYLELFHYFRLNVPTFVEFYPFGAIRRINKENVKFRTLFKKCTTTYFVSFCRNCSTFLVSNPNILFCSFLPMFFWIF